MVQWVCIKTKIIHSSCPCSTIFGMTMTIPTDQWLLFRRTISHMGELLSLMHSKHSERNQVPCASIVFDCLLSTSLPVLVDTNSILYTKVSSPLGEPQIDKVGISGGQSVCKPGVWHFHQPRIFWQLLINGHYIPTKYGQKYGTVPPF